MTHFARLEVPGSDTPGYRTVAGSTQGLDRLLLVSGRLPPAEEGPVHLHYGEEILHIVSGRLFVRIGDTRRECGPGEVVAVPAGIWHGYRAIEETVLEVIAEQRIGTVFPVRAAGPHSSPGTELVEVYRRDMPWGRTPPPGHEWTSDEEMQAILDAQERGV